MPFAVLGIDHIEVFVRDIADSAAWYERVLGLKPAGGWEPEPMLIGAGDNFLALFKARAAGPDNADDPRQPAIRWRRVAWRTDQDGFQAAQKYLQAMGVDYDGPTDHGDNESVYFADPDGNPLEITYDRPA